MVDFKRFLQSLSPENQLYEINSVINKFNKSNCPGDNIKKKNREKHVLKRANNN